MSRCTLGVCSEHHRLGYKVTINHRCPKLKLGIDIVHIKREWGAEFGWKKLTGECMEVSF
jgi:hypothetical protein